MPLTSADAQKHLTGGDAEAKAAYEEAYNAIFELQLDHHAHLQPYRNNVDGKTKWAKIEMWPIMVSTAQHHQGKLHLLPLSHSQWQLCML